MKSQLITVLSVVGVVATASAAMAINSDALTTVSNGAIGGAAEVLVPTDNHSTLPATATPTPSAPSTDVPPAAEPAEPTQSDEPAQPEQQSPPPVTAPTPKPSRTSTPTSTPAPTPTPTRTRHDDGGEDDD